MVLLGRNQNTDTKDSESSMSRAVPVRLSPINIPRPSPSRSSHPRARRRICGNLGRGRTAHFSNCCQTQSQFRYLCPNSSTSCPHSASLVYLSLAPPASTQTSISLACPIARCRVQHRARRQRTQHSQAQSKPPSSSTSSSTRRTTPILRLYRADWLCGRSIWRRRGLGSLMESLVRYTSADHRHVSYQSV